MASGDRIVCFWMEPAPSGHETLRRYAAKSLRFGVVESAERIAALECPTSPWKYHNADVTIAEPAPYPIDVFHGWGKDDIAHDDPRWPKTCDACPYVFLPEDEWQHNMDRYFRGAPDGKLHRARELPAGAMFNADWWDEPGPDGISLAVVLPPGGHTEIWMPDSAGKDCGAWKRTGTIPKVTCTPSILTPRYHGFLTDGVLIEC